MQTKILEVRDEGTYFAVLAVDMNPEPPLDAHIFGPDDRYNAQRYHLGRVGYPCDGRPNIAITHLSADGGKCWNDPYGWGDRTNAVAHKYIIDNWTKLRDGDVVDVEHILKEKPTKKISERVKTYEVNGTLHLSKKTHQEIERRGAGSAEISED
jgi:hypothetical protein